MTERDYPEEFTTIAAELHRLPYLAPSANFADRVIAGVTVLNKAGAVVPAPRRAEISPPARSALILHGADPAIVRARRSTLARRTVGVAAFTGVAITAAIIFQALDVIGFILTAFGLEMAPLVASAAAGAGALVIGDTAMAALQAGAAQAALLYIVAALGLAGGFVGLRTAALIAQKKAA